MKSPYLTHIEIIRFKNQNRTIALEMFPAFPRQQSYTTVQLFRKRIPSFSPMLCKACHSLTISLPSRILTLYLDTVSLGGKQSNVHQT